MKPTTRAWKLVAGTNLLLVLLLGVWAYLAWNASQEGGQQALLDGRLVEVNVATGETAGGKPMGDASGTEMPSATQPSPETSSAMAPPELPAPSGGLADAPFAPITEQSEYGPLPVVAADGTKAWQHYARPFTPEKNTLHVSVLVVGLGLSNAITETALRLPGEISLSFSPYAPNATVWAGAARAAGHEVLSDMPLETSANAKADPGPLAFFTTNTPEQNDLNLRRVMGKTVGLVGLHLPNRQEYASLDKQRAPETFKPIAARGLMAVTSETAPTADIVTAMKTAGVPYVLADMRLDAEITTEEARELLQQMESLARQKGDGLVVVYAGPGTLEALSEWAQHIDQKGLILAPVSALARKRFS